MPGKTTESSIGIRGRFSMVWLLFSKLENEYSQQRL
jgi:hypothetical protein